MHGDFTRWTHDPKKHFLRVLMQQGRVQLDADWNEQASILLHYLRTLAADLIGPFGGPGKGFLVQGLDDDQGDPIPRAFLVRAGRYYVDGILVENDEELRYGESEEDDHPFPPVEPRSTAALVLDVWERHVSHLQDDRIREVALGGPDTASRSQVAWRVRAWPLDFGISMAGPCEVLADQWEDLLKRQRPANRGRLRARASAEGVPKPDPCLASPEASYRGTENHLYRVEIHRGGKAWDGSPGTRGAVATFKWSRDNGSEEYRVLRLEGTTAFLETLGRDDRTRLCAGDWVELVDDQQREPLLPLFKVKSVDPRRDAVELEVDADTSLPDYDEVAARQRHTLLRRWHHRKGKPARGGQELSGGAALLTEGTLDKEDEGWLALEDGIEIRFEPGLQAAAYRPQDFWLIPARTATGDVEWPRDHGEPVPLPPHGVDHHFAPLATVELDDKGLLTLTDCRKVFKNLIAGLPADGT